MFVVSQELSQRCSLIIFPFYLVMKTFMMNPLRVVQMSCHQP